MSNTHVLPWLVNTGDVVCLTPLEFKTLDLSDNVDHYHCRSIDMMRCKPYDRRPTWIGNSLTISDLQASGSLRIAVEYYSF
jgi:proline racemase